jgi:dienelactone hydrolase
VHRIRILVSFGKGPGRISFIRKDILMNQNVTERSVEIPVDSAILLGDLVIPGITTALVIFAHGSGSSRLSPRNRFVASALQKDAMATLLFDLLTPEEDRDYDMRFNIELLTQRLEAATLWVAAQPDLAGFPLGYFGASTGAAAALGAAADLSERIGAVVSRGGRPDLTPRDLGLVRAATLLIVGGLDDVVIQLNRQAYSGLTAKKEMQIVQGATHLFEEPGTLEEVARLASDWFRQHLSGPLR